jgi:hypothetical protein
MLRALLLSVALAVVTFAQFALFPGHTYLEGESQIYVPVIERLDAPGYLSRDLTATHPHVAYTIYDEITLFLHQGVKLSFEHALAIQQLLFRGAGVFGIFLLLRAGRISGWYAVLIAAVLSTAATLPGISGLMLGAEPTPRVFAFGAALLSMGALAWKNPLVSGLAAGVALLYDTSVAAPLWIAILAACIFDRRLRSMLRPFPTILIIFLLLLGNLAQLQPGAPEAPKFLSALPPDVRMVQQLRTPQFWVTLWQPGILHAYVAIFVTGLWAIMRIWPLLSRELRWLLLFPSCAGAFSIAFSYVLLDHLHWSLVPAFEPMKALAYTCLATLIAVTIAALASWKRTNFKESACWFSALLVLLVFHWSGIGKHADRRQVVTLASWAEANTWGSSLFLFPAANRDLLPGVFRALSRRAVWVDWGSGCLAKYAGQPAIEWWSRWHQTMNADLSRGRLNTITSLPIDYLVLPLQQPLAGLSPVFTNRAFAVYDAHDLRDLRNRPSAPR